MEGYADWWTNSGMIGLPPQTKVKGVGRQQQQSVTIAFVFLQTTSTERLETSLSELKTELSTKQEQLLELRENHEQVSAGHEHAVVGSW